MKWQNEKPTIAYTPARDDISVHDPSATITPRQVVNPSRADRLSQIQREHRDRVYIRKDILLQLYTLGPMNQTKLVTHCGLNITNHQDILAEMVQRDLLVLTRTRWGNRSMSTYGISQKGIEILKMIFEPYEQMFPRKTNLDNNNTLGNFPKKIEIQEELAENKNSNRSSQVQIIQTRLINRN